MEHKRNEGYVIVSRTWVDKTIFGDIDRFLSSSAFILERTRGPKVESQSAETHINYSYKHLSYDVDSSVVGA